MKKYITYALFRDPGTKEEGTAQEGAVSADNGEAGQPADTQGEAENNAE